MKTNLNFSKEELEKQLSRLTGMFVTIFALSCAQRFYSQLTCYTQLQDQPTSSHETFEDAIQFGWSAMISGSIDKVTAKHFVDLAEQNAPVEDHAYAVGCPYALDAAIILMRAIETMCGDPVKNAIRSAETAYSLADAVVMDNWHENTYTINSSEILRSEFVQLELGRQRRDWEELKEIAANSSQLLIATHFRQRAISEADDILNVIKSKR